MITYDELKKLNGAIVAEAMKELGLQGRDTAKLDRIARSCTAQIAKNEALKKRLARDSNYQLRCQAIDARSLPLRDILRIVREGA